MRGLIFLIILFTVTSCENNPFGETNFLACEHSPQENVGLPVTCQVSIPSTDGLVTWFDAHDAGTLSLQEQSILTSWVDKSGEGISLTPLNGFQATLNKKSSNNRNSIFFETLGSYTAGGGLLGVSSGSSFTLAISFKINSLNSDSISFNNGSDFSISTNSNQKITYTIGATSNESSFTLKNNTLINLIIVYNSSTQVITIQDSGNDFLFSKSSTPSSGLWSDVQISGLDTDLNEIIIYNKTVDPSSIQSYLNNKWGF